MSIKQLRSLNPGSIPTTASLGEGELAINVPDGRIFLRKSGSTSDTIESAITTGAQNSGSINLTGSLNLFTSTGSAFAVNADSIVIEGSLTVNSGSTKTNLAADSTYNGNPLIDSYTAIAYSVAL